VKIEVAQADLARGLGVVARAVSTRSNLPVLANVLTQAEKDGLRLTTTNLAVGLVAWIPARVAKTGETTIPAAMFADLVDSLSDGSQIGLETDASWTTKLQSGGFKASLKGLDPEDFPAMKTLEGEALTRLKQADLRRGLAETVHAASSDNTRGILTGVLCEFDGSTLTLAATDNYRVAASRVPIESVEPKVEVVIPAIALGELERVLTGDDEVTVVLAKGRNEIMFSIPGIDVVCRLLSGAFVPFRRAIPETASTTVTVAREALLGLVRPSILIARAGGNSLRLDMADGITVSSAAEIGDHVGTLDAKVEGDPVSVIMNAKYLSDALTCLDAETLVVAINGPLRPVVFRRDGQGDASVQSVSPINPAASKIGA
jgi:DNA polymerase III subunit beta